MPLLYLFLVVGGVFSALGALMAALITYHEYRRHYPNEREPRRMAVRTGLFTFTFFMLLMLALAYLLPTLSL